MERRFWIWLPFVGIFSLAYYLWFYDYGLNLSDEGYLVYGARRVLSGQVPGADFHAYMPGRYLVLSLFFKLFGQNIIVERLMWVIVRVIIALLFFRLSTRLLPPVVALVPTLLIIFVPGPWHKGFELLFPLFWLLSVHGYLTQQRKWSIFFLGLASGLTFFFRLEIGIITLVLSGMILGVNRMVTFRADVQPTTALSRPRRCVFSHELVIFVSSFLLVLLPYVVFLWCRSGILKSVFFYAHELLAGLGGSNPFLVSITSVVRSATSPQEVGVEGPVPYLLGCFGLVYLIMFGVLCFIFFRRRWGNIDFFVFILTIYGFAQLYQVISSLDVSHLLQAGPFTYLLASFLLYEVYGKIIKTESIHRPISFLRNVSAIAFVGGGLALSLFFLLIILRDQEDFYYTGSFRVRQPDMISLASDRAHVFVQAEAADEILGALNYIKTNSNPDEGLTAMIYLPMFNFLAERENPLFYDIFFPHHVGSPANQKRIVDNMRCKAPKFIVTTSGLVSLSEMGLAEERFRDYGKRLMEFVGKRYHVVQDYGAFVILEKTNQAGIWTDDEAFR